MTKKLTIITAILVLSIGFYFISSAPIEIQSGLEKQKLFIVNDDGVKHEFTVEVALDEESQLRGLMFRENLAKDEGMLFYYEKPAIVGMWMKNTLIPLDMIFIANNGVIVDIYENAEPHSEKPIFSSKPIIAVLEVPGGTANELGISINNRILHELFNNKH